MKITIIGGGVCGLYLAKNLAERNHKITVFEKKKTIGKLCCSGLFSARLFDFVPEARGLATNQINRCIINFPKKKINLKFRPPFFVIDHARLDLLVAALATRAGANIRIGQNIDFARLETLSAEYDRIIGCDGALSTIRQYLISGNQTSCAGQTHAKLRGSDPRKNNRPNFMLGIQGFEQKADDSDFVETWATKNGFLWRIPRSEDVEWGIMEEPDVARRLFDEFIAQKNIKLEDLRSAIIPQGLTIPQNKKITLCGDASGLTKPWSGGGVIWNLTQADLLLKNFPNFIQYRKEAKRFFGLRLFAGNFAKKCAYFTGFNLPWIIPGDFNLDGDYLLKFKRNDNGQSRNSA